MSASGVMLLDVYSDSGWAQSIINTSHLIITSQQQARDSCKTHHSIDKYNNQQPLRICNRDKRARASSGAQIHKRDRRFRLCSCARIVF